VSHLHFDREIYFDCVRGSLFGGSMTQDQVIGQEAILLRWEIEPLSDDLRHLAYALSTTMHETANTFQPIEEYQGSKQSYGQVDPETGQAYFGRGYVQLTHRENYSKATAELGLLGDDDLEWHAERALDPAIAADVMFFGMTYGWFRPPNKLDLYFSDVADDTYGAREIINGDKHIIPSWSGGVSIGKLIGGYHQHFLDALVKSSKPKTVIDVKLDITVPPGLSIQILINGEPI
jgi:putative chitinase